MSAPSLTTRTHLETLPLLDPPPPTLTTPQNSSSQAHSKVTKYLYLSHFLSTWNSRVFEFAALLYLANIFPGTLLPMSVYALARGASAIVFSPVVGQVVDKGSRLGVVRFSIVLQRVTVAFSCAGFYVLACEILVVPVHRSVVLALLAVLACGEKLGSVMNMIAVERDWVIVITEGDNARLLAMNAQMRRIDLVCKLIGPLCIACINGISAEVAILANLGLNIASVGVEYYTIAMVYHAVPELKLSKKKLTDSSPDGNLTRRAEHEGSLAHNWVNVKVITKKSVQDFGLYFRHPAFLPSFAGALLYLTVLSFSGQMVTYLLSAGYSVTHITLGRTLSVVFEVLSTWFSPWLMGNLGPIRAGLWLSTCQITCLVGGIAIFWICEDRPSIAASSLVGGTILSRLGLRGFDLCIQIIIQEEVESADRGAFSSVEAAFQNAFEICSYMSTIIISRPDQFKWPALISVVAVVAAGALYTNFVHSRRGHLLHLSKLAFCVPSRTRQERVREDGLERIRWSGNP